MLHKKGKVFQNYSGESFSDLSFRAALAKVLKEELGGTNRAAKSIMKWANVSERTAKNWLGGTHSPSGEHLIELMRHSDAVLDVVLCLANRRSALATVHIDRLIAHLNGTVQDLKELASDAECDG